MPNKSVVYFLVVDFGEGCCRCSSCDNGKTKSTPSPFDLDWNGLGLEFDNRRKYSRLLSSRYCDKPEALIK